MYAQVQATKTTKFIRIWFTSGPYIQVLKREQKEFLVTLTLLSVEPCYMAGKICKMDLLWRWLDKVNLNDSEANVDSKWFKLI